MTVAKILLVGDDLLELGPLAAELEGDGFGCLQAASAFEARAHLERGDIGAVLALSDNAGAAILGWAADHPEHLSHFLVLRTADDQPILEPDSQIATAALGARDKIVAWLRRESTSTVEVSLEIEDETTNRLRLVLIDEALTSEPLRAEMTRYGMTPLTFAESDEAIAFAKERAIDAIVLDGRRNTAEVASVYDWAERFRPALLDSTVAVGGRFRSELQRRAPAARVVVDSRDPRVIVQVLVALARAGE